MISISFTDYPAQVINWAVGPEGIAWQDANLRGRTVLGGFENGVHLLYRETRLRFKQKPNISSQKWNHGLGHRCRFHPGRH